jgi:hypothetical protein
VAAGCFSGKFVLTGSIATLDSLTGGTQTYNVVAFRRVSGAVQIGGSGLTAANGYPLIQGEEIVMEGAIVGANLNLIGPGEVQFFGNSTA